MDKILIDIDNNTPGAITIQIVEFLRPKGCLLQKYSKRDIFNLSMVDKYFYKTVGNPPCRIETFFEQKVCRKHSPDYVELKLIYGAHRRALANRSAYVHFSSKKIADKAVCYISTTQRCCWGTGLKL